MNPSLRPGGSTRSTFDINYRDAYAMNWNLNLQKQLGRDYMVELAYVGSRGRQLTLKTNLNQAPPDRSGVTNADINRPVVRGLPRAAQRGHGRRARARSTTTRCSSRG